jgi:hypothetical protein
MGKIESRFKLIVVDAVGGNFTDHGKHEIHGGSIVHGVDIVEAFSEFKG